MSILMSLAQEQFALIGMSLAIPTHQNYWYEMRYADKIPDNFYARRESKLRVIFKTNWITGYLTIARVPVSFYLFFYE